jgi:hypothetical protein
MRYWEIISDNLSRAGWSLAVSQAWILAPEQSGSRTRIATTASVSSCTRMKADCVSKAGGSGSPPTAVPIRSGSRAAASSVANEVVGQRLRAPRCGEAVSWGHAYFITPAGLKSPSNSWPSQSLTSTYHSRLNGSTSEMRSKPRLSLRGHKYLVASQCG